MLLTVHDSKMKKVAFIENAKPKTLNYEDEMFIEDLPTATSTFDFVVPKKTLEYDTVTSKTFNILNDRAFVSFREGGITHVFNVMSVEEDEKEIKCFCEVLPMEFLLEEAAPYKATTKQTFVEYLDLFGMLKNGGVTIGLNEVEDFERTLEWTGTDTKLKRLQSIANMFDAEIQFETKLNKDSSLKALILNIYKENDGKNNQGVGKVRNDLILTYPSKIAKITRKTDKYSILNRIIPTGKKTVDVVVSKPNPKYVAPQVRTITYSGGGLSYAGRSISKESVQALLQHCQANKLLPSGVLTQLYVESFWGKSTVGQVDNNWGGMTWTGSTTRPSGVVVSRGMARPANEGGYYNHYASVGDYFKDYTYLLANQGIYKVKGAETLDAFTRGLFKDGGALYNYAAIGYNHYIYSMRDVRYNVNRLNNNALDTLDNQYRTAGVITTQGKATNIQIATRTKQVISELTALKGRRVGSGQCYALSALYSMKLGGAGLGGGVDSIRGLIRGGMAASNIGTDYNWGQFGWKTVVPNKVADLLSGSIANIKAYAGSPVYTSMYGHTVIIKSLSGDTLTVLEQNFAGHQWVEERTYSASQYLRIISTLVYPKELVQGKRVDAKDTTTNTTTVVVENGNNEPKTISETKQQEKITTLKDVPYREWKNDEGLVEFYLKDGALHAPLSKEKYPSVFTGEETKDNWIEKPMELETDDIEYLISKSIQELRKYSIPPITYEVQGFDDSLRLGDTVRITDNGFEPTLILSARVTRREVSLSDPSKNKLRFDNYRALKDRTSALVVDRYEELSEMAKPYDLRLLTDNGVVFKNGQGQSTLWAELWKNNRKYDASFQFKNIDTLLSSGWSYVVNANEITEKFIIEVEAYIGNDYITTAQVTFSNVNDGKDGLKGLDGIDGNDGLPGANGENSYVHIAYANSPDGLSGFSTEDGLNKTYIGIYTDFVLTDSLSPLDYKWTLIKGSKGDQGIPGQTGDDGRTPYFHTAWSTSPTGATGFSVTESAGKTYIGTYTDYTFNDSADPTKYKWVYIKGEKGDKGALDETQVKEITDKIDKKADSELTQDQLNALSEQANIVRAEIEAKASLSELFDVIAKYEDYVAKNDKDKATSEQELASIVSNLKEQISDLKDTAIRWNFIDNYFKIQNDALIFGNVNGSAFTKMSDDRFSIFSSGTEVMYISKGTLFIENGIFSISVQIGRFREEQYYGNPDINVCRYVG